MNADINVVPYIDVMLVLLIIFMVTAPLMTQGIDVDLPDANAESMTVPEDPPTLQILADGSYKLNGETLSEDALGAKAQELAQARPEQMMLVNGDKKVPYEYVAKGMAILRGAGVTKIGFVTEAADDTAGKTNKR
ncbi:ExbD/TolR family protein [Solimonas soli]|uniref:ExbD/TolR family protein n=1 Tax=Solimonas soli TaxID=413479 RepID=UPI001FDFF723|nr:ExbD/TolR family protein [Solimonas soli]